MNYKDRLSESYTLSLAISREWPKKYRSSDACCFKANHLVYIVLRCHGSRIYTDCQQNLFSSEHDTGARILLVTFLTQQKLAYEALR